MQHLIDSFWKTSLFNYKYNTWIAAFASHIS